MKFDEGELSGSTYLGEGAHEVRIVKLTPMASKTKGTPQVEVEFAAPSGKTTRDWFVTEGNKFKLAALALACGFKKDQLLAGAFETPQLMGKRLKLVREITGKTDDGKNKYDNSYLPSGAASAPAQTDDIPF